MDGVSPGNEAEQSQCRDLGATSSSSASTGLGWRPSQFVFTPYVLPGEILDKSQTLCVVVRNPMALRRTWMQYHAVRSTSAAVRFFVGLHKNQIVNEELWKEAETYRDIQLMPFVDYYSLITWKTLAICIFGTEGVSAKFVMKANDDAFVRVDEVLASLNRINVNTGLLYGLVNLDSRPHCSTDSKWYISPEPPEEVALREAHEEGVWLPLMLVLWELVQPGRNMRAFNCFFSFQALLHESFKTGKINFCLIVLLIAMLCSYLSP